MEKYFWLIAGAVFCIWIGTQVGVKNNPPSKPPQNPTQSIPTYPVEKQFYDAYWGTKVIEGKLGQKYSLAGIGSVCLIININDKLSSVMQTKNTSEFRDSMEIFLRKNGLIVDENSSDILELSISTLDDQVDTSPVIYELTLFLYEPVNVVRAGFIKRDPVILWKNGYYGRCGANTVKASIYDACEKSLVSFSNDLLSQNPK